MTVQPETVSRQFNNQHFSVLAASRGKPMFQDIHAAYMPPFQIIGNLYFVGTKPASVHLIDTGEGLVLLDSGYDALLELVLENIHALGFHEKQIRYILHSHGHIDHIGATKRLSALSGAQTVIGRYDRDYASGARDLTYARELGLRYDTAFLPDLLLDDGDALQLGNTKIFCLHTPGHTEGTMSYFFYLNVPNRELIAGTHGGIGMNTMSRAFLQTYGLPLSLRDDFRKGLHRLRQIHVDVFIPNHQDQWNTTERYQKKLAGDEDAFVDAAAWPAYLDMAEQRLNALLEGEQNGL